MSLSLGAILLIILTLVLLGVFPAWPHGLVWGYAPTGLVGLGLSIVLVLLLLGRIQSREKIAMSLSSMGFTAVFLLSIVLVMDSCQPERAAEKVGKKMDQAVDKIETQADEAGKR